MTQEQAIIDYWENKFKEQADRIAKLETALTGWEIGFDRMGYERLLKDQENYITELKEFAIWMTGCGYDFTQHEYFIKCRDRLLVGANK